MVYNLCRPQIKRLRAPIMFKKTILITLLVLSLASCKNIAVTDVPPSVSLDLRIVNGMVYDGLGGEPYRADIGIEDDRIVAIGNAIR